MIRNYWVRIFAKNGIHWLVQIGGTWSHENENEESSTSIYINVSIFDTIEYLYTRRKKWVTYEL